MRQTKARFASKKWLLLLAIPALIALLVALLWPHMVPPMVEKRIHSHLALQPDEKLEMQNFRVGIFPLRFSADSLELSKNIHLPNQAYRLETKIRKGHIELPLSVLWENSSTAYINKFQWSSAAIALTALGRDSVAVQDSTSFPALHIASLKLDSTRIKASRNDQFLRALAHLQLDELHIHPDSTRWQDIALRVDSLDIKKLTPIYNLRIASLQAHSRQKTLRLQKIALEHSQSRRAIQASSEYMVVQQQFWADEITLDSVGLNRTHEGFYAHAMRIVNPLFDLYQDMRVPRSPKEKLLPSARLLQIPHPFRIDSVLAVNGRLRYEEHNTRSEETGRLKGKDWSVRTGTITNIDQEHSTAIAMESNITFMDHAALKIRARFDSTSPDHSFQVSGVLGRSRFDQFNPILEPILGISFREGSCQDIHFSMYGNNQAVQGELRARYSGLKIGFPDSEQNMINRSLSWLANKSLVRSSAEHEPHPIDLQRPKNVSFINYWWKALRNTLLEIMLRHHELFEDTTQQN